MKKRALLLAITSMSILLVLFFMTDRSLTVFKATLIKSDLKVDNLVLISNGKQVYMPSHLVFENVSAENIKDVKCFITKKNEVILDLFFQMDGLRQYDMDVERYLKHVGFDKQDKLTITLEYKVNDRVKQETYLMKVAEHLYP